MNKNKSNITNNKKWLIVGASVLGATTIAFGSLFSCANGGGGSGGSYKPGTEVKVQAAVSDPTGGQYEVTFGSDEEKAVVGQKYHGTITLTPKNEATQECYLPEKLVSVISNTTVLEEENYTYTLASTRKTATLDIPADYVCGPVVVNLALVTPSEPGPGPEPEPVVWEDATQEDVLASRNNAQIQRFGKNPFIFLSTLEGEGTQYKITITEEEKAKMSNIDLDVTTTTFEIDTSTFYIKREVKKNETTENIDYYTCRKSEINPGYYALYNCFLSGGTTPTHNELYTMPSYDMVSTYFNDENNKVSNLIVEMCGSKYYKYDAFDKQEDNLIDDTIEGYQENFKDLEIEVAMIYKKGNSTSFKITNETQTVYEGINVEGDFEFTMQNSQLVKYHKSMIAVNSSSQEEMMHDVFEFKTERATFTPDDLDPYFAD